MVKNFNDYEYKDTKIRIKLKLKQIKEKRLNPWEISSFLNKFNTYYYKAELLNTIAIALNKNIEPENIIIFNQSFKLNQQYTKLDFISTTDNDLAYLYYIGLPVSLFPDKNIHTLNILFKYFRKYYELLNKIKKSSNLKPKNLSKYYSRYMTSNFESMFILMKEDVKECTKNIQLEASEIQNFSNLDEKFRAEYIRYEEDEEKINEIKNKLRNNDINEKDFKSKTFGRYFVQFYTYLNNVQRPMIIVNNKDSHVMSILCRAQFNKSASMASTLDLESISHNSPFKAIINGGSQLYRIFISGNREEELKSMIEKKKELKLNLEKDNAESIQAAIEKIDKEYATLEKIDKAEKLTNANEINNINIPHVKNKLQHFLNNNQSLSTKLLKQNNFEPDLSDTDVYHYKIDV